jgi:HPt (histidine-containing phosphotransfer) domain-containing protein
MIDWDRVELLRAEVGPDSFGEVVKMFLEEAADVIARLESGKGSIGLEAELHFLKGAALNLGLTDLATICHDKEKRVAAGQRISTERLAECYRLSLAAFEAGLRERRMDAA